MAELEKITYSATTWTNGETALSAKNMNNLETGISNVTTLANSLVDASKGAVLEEALTANVTVGGVYSGTTFEAGTSLEYILRTMLYVPLRDWYVGEIPNAHPEVYSAYSDSEVTNCIIKGFTYSDTETSYVFTPKYEKSAFLVLLRDGAVEPSEAVMVSYGSGSTPWTTNFTATDIEEQSSWLFATEYNGTERRTIAIDGYTYNAYAYYNSTWSITGTNPDTITFTIAQTTTTT